MSKKNPLYILWPLLALLAPLYILDRLTAPSWMWKEFSLSYMLWAWQYTPGHMFSLAPVYSFLAYGALVSALFWWFRRPQTISGLALFLAGFFTGPSGSLMFWILFGGNIGHS